MSQPPDNVAPGTQLDPQILRKAMPLADFRYDEAYPDLVRLAETGDSMAAYKLWLGLQTCAHVPRDREALEQQKNRVLETRVIDGMAANDEWIANHIRDLEQRFPFCSTVPAEVDARAAAYMWLTKAAEAGFVTALLDFVSAIYMTQAAPPEVIPRHREMLERLEAAAVDGNPVALSRLSIIYSKDHPDLPRDYVKAQAYIIASREILSAPISLGADGNMVGAAWKLSTGELVQAEALRAQIVRAAQTQFPRAGIAN